MRSRESADARVFPSDPPPSLTDADVIAKHDWAAFDKIAEMTDHWSRPGWGPGSRRYYWFLTTDHAPKVARHVEECQRALTHLGFDPVPPDGLHLTVSRIADAKDLQHDDLDRLVSSARQRCGRLDPFRMSVVPMSGSRGAIRYSIAPWRPLWDVHGALTAACHDIGLTGLKPTSSFRPHLGIAYCNRRVDATAAQRAVQELRNHPALEVPVREVHLVELRQVDRAYRWRRIHTVPIGERKEAP